VLLAANFGRDGQDLRQQHKAHEQTAAQHKHLVAFDPGGAAFKMFGLFDDPGL